MWSAFLDFYPSTALINRRDMQGYDLHLSMPVEVAHYGLRRRASKKEFVPPNGSFLKQVNWSKCAEEALPIDLSEGFNFDDAVKGELEEEAADATPLTPMLRCLDASVATLSQSLLERVGFFRLGIT